MRNPYTARATPRKLRKGFGKKRRTLHTLVIYARQLSDKGPNRNFRIHKLRPCAACNNFAALNFYRPRLRYAGFFGVSTRPF